MNLQLTDAQKRNFQTLVDAAKADRLALVSCQDASTGELVPTLCAVNEDGDQIELVPFGRLFDGNPYDQLLPPVQEN